MTAKKSVQKKKKEEEVWYCWHCGEKINPSEKISVLSTFDKTEEIEVAFFHFNCWKDYFQEKVREAAEKLKSSTDVMGMQQKAKGLFSMFGMNDLSDLTKLTKFLPKNFRVDLQKLSDDIDPKEVERVLRECGVDPNKTKTKKKDGKKTTKKKQTKKKSKK